MNQWLGVEAVKVALHVDKPKGTEVNNLVYHKAGAADLTELYRTLAKKYPPLLRASTPILQCRVCPHSP